MQISDCVEFVAGLMLGWLVCFFIVNWELAMAKRKSKDGRKFWVWVGITLLTSVFLLSGCQLVSRLCDTIDREVNNPPAPTKDEPATKTEGGMDEVTIRP